MGDRTLGLSLKGEYGLKKVRSISSNALKYDA